MARTRSTVVSARLGPVAVTLDVMTRDVVTRSQRELTDEERNVVTRWVIERLSEYGWTVVSPLRVRDSLWGGGAAEP